MLGREIGNCIAALPEAEKFDMIIPVPLHKAKQRDRSYNQSEYIAKGISGVLNLPIINNAVSEPVLLQRRQSLTKPKDAKMFQAHLR